MVNKKQMEEIIKKRQSTRKGAKKIRMTKSGNYSISISPSIIEALPGWNNMWFNNVAISGTSFTFTSGCEPEKIKAPPYVSKHQKWLMDEFGSKIFATSIGNIKF